MDTKTIYTPLPSFEDCYLSRVCPTCKARPWIDCDVKRGNRKMHLTRTRGSNNNGRWSPEYKFVEERETGKRYDSIDPHRVRVWHVSKRVFTVDENGRHVRDIENSERVVPADEMVWTDDTKTVMVVPDE
ncbi:hypothetical protein [Nocardiopsis metallicus]|uniref:Uncharacterized protein n=1 Tax=Nocardiopsis metallicus TaxID=179819 RepID=A0A840WHM5_9ACTN|nr:hypothetical protein [Nocardiopsis metallicus]MBB5490966.1 hypothetical protein [Nocardiopsis metallicus]